MQGSPSVSVMTIGATSSEIIVSFQVGPRQNDELENTSTISAASEEGQKPSQPRSQLASCISFSKRQKYRRSARGHSIPPASIDRL